MHVLVAHIGSWKWRKEYLSRRSLAANSYYSDENVTFLNKNDKKVLLGSNRQKEQRIK